MPAKLWNWLIALGALVSIAGLIFFPAALTEPARDEALLAAGGAMVGVGALMIAISFYFKASAIREEIAASPQLSAMLAGKRLKASCDTCKEGAAVITCSMHKKALCGNCLAQHYDSRACVYLPAARRSATRGAKGATAGRA
jgi:hypothetical protein